MPDTKTDRSNCQFVLERTGDGKPVVMLRLLHDTIPIFRNAAVGFDLLSGIRPEQAQRLADLLNEYVLNVFVTMTEKGAKA